jgi:hypothetical protein
MRYSVGESLADFGFCFLENLHEPIFLVNRLGNLIRVNEAGRKFLRVTNVHKSDLRDFVRTKVASLFQGLGEAFRRVQLDGCQLIARSFSGTDYILIEVVNASAKERSSNRPQGL